MEKNEKKEQWTEEAVVEYLRKAAGSEPIPENLRPQHT